MRINPAALERLSQAPLTGEGLVRIFNEMMPIAQEAGPNCCASLNLDYQDQDAPIEDGDLIPVITITLRPATIVVKTA